MRARAHQKENPPPMFYAVRSSDPIRVLSPRQLPTDHDCAVPTREYQSDQPSHSLLVLSLTRSLSQDNNPNTTCSNRLYLTLDRSLHIKTSTSAQTESASRWWRSWR